MTKVQKAFIAAAASAALGVGSLGVSTAFAAANDAHPGLENLVQAIATKFNLNVDDVQKVFDEQRALGMAEHQAKFEQHAADMLAKAVADGKLTQAQADLITAKRAELEANKPDFTGKTPEEIRDTMKTQGDAVKAWAEANNIPEQYLLPRGPMMMHFKGPGGPHGDNQFFDEKITQ